MTMTRMGISFDWLGVRPKFCFYKHDERGAAKSTWKEKNCCRPLKRACISSSLTPSAYALG
jgi:hypothetical protein